MPPLKRYRWLGIAIEQDDAGRYHVTQDGERVHSTGSLPVAEAHLDVLAEELQAANPHLKNPRDLLAREQAFSDVLSVRGEARTRARSQADAKGGKGGRSGV